MPHAGRLVGVLLLTGCSTAPLPVADTPTTARAPDGAFIHWVEHRIDDVGLTGVAIRGGDGLQLADLDRDGHPDIVSVHEDSHHLRIAFGTGDPQRWDNVTVASGPVVGAIEDVAVGDLDGDGWPDLAAACEEAHVAVFINPRKRAADWPAEVIPASTGRGSWLQVAIADLDGDGANEVLGANKGTADIVRLPAGERPNLPNSRFVRTGDGWREDVLHAAGIPNQVLTVDIDGDCDLDLLTAERTANRMTLLLNDGIRADGVLQVRPQPIVITAGFPAPDGWAAASNAFNAVFADIDGDGRLDLVLNAVERDRPDARPWSRAGLVWLQQPADLTAPWRLQRIGSTLPDWVIGVGVADIDGDGYPDAVSGGYSGLNVLRGGYSGHSRDVDDPRVTPSETVARMSWFQHPGDADGSWQRHDILRRVRGMVDEFAFADLDGDGDTDIIATNGNAGDDDGVFWLEQRRSATPQPALTTTRRAPSRGLPLPPADWRDRYGAAVEYVAPNKAAQEEALREGAQSR